MPHAFVWTAPYVWSLVLLVLGIVLLLGLALRLLGVVRRTRSAQRAAAADVQDKAGLLKARIAGLRVAVAERRNGTA